MLQNFAINRLPLETNSAQPEPQIKKEYLWRGKFIGIRCENGWEYVERTRGSGVVAVIALTVENKIILTEQTRPPLGASVIDLPAGLTGDENGAESESVQEAAKRELLEETGYEANKVSYLFSRPTSAGLTNETVKYVLTELVTHTSQGGGVGSERITVHSIPLYSIDKWLFQKELEGCVTDPKIDVALRYLNSLHSSDKTKSSERAYDLFT